MTDLKYPIEMVNGVPVVAAPAEIDIGNADWLDAVLLEAGDRGYGKFVVDLTRTRFCDSSCISSLVRAHNRAVAEGGELRLVVPTSATVVRVFGITGLDQVIPHFPSLDEALEPAPVTAPLPPPDPGTTSISLPAQCFFIGFATACQGLLMGWRTGHMRCTIRVSVDEAAVRTSGLAAWAHHPPRRPVCGMSRASVGRWAQMTAVSYPIEMLNGVPVVAAPEEIDVTNVGWLRSVLLQAADRGHGRFVVDMTRTQFCASAGVVVLVRAHKRAQAEGGELRLVIPTSGAVRRIFELTSVDQIIPNFAGLDEALEPAPAAPQRRHRHRHPKPGMRLHTDRQAADPDARSNPA
jgi:anti-sigma B factor antagonist